MSESEKEFKLLHKYKYGVQTCTGLRAPDRECLDDLARNEHKTPAELVREAIYNLFRKYNVNPKDYEVIVRKKEKST